MPGKQPLVSVVIVNWNGLEDTKACLKYLKNQTYGNFEIVVVDNGSDDGSLDFLRRVKDVALVENPRNLGFTGGHITGYKSAKGDYILLLNNDAIMDPGYIERAVGVMQSDYTIGALGGRAYLWDEDNELFDTTNNFYAYQNINPITAEGIFANSDAGVPQEVNNVSGSCVMIRRKVIDEIGYLHDPFFAYFEESDLFARMKRGGFKVVYHPELAIWHANGKSSNKKSPTFSLYMMMRNRFRFAVRNFDNWSLLRFLKFYLKMGIASMVKSLLPLEQRGMHRAYAKAFLYNLILGWIPFAERHNLQKELGASNYNRMIVREQTGISIVMTTDTIKDLDSVKSVAEALTPIDEVIVVTSREDLAERIRQIAEELPIVRGCIDRGFFNTHPQNLGAIIAKHEWQIILDTDTTKNAAELVRRFSGKVYLAIRLGKKIAIASSSRPENFEGILHDKIGSSFMLERSLLIDFGGFGKDITLDKAKRQLIAYGSLAKSALLLALDTGTGLAPYDVGAEALYQQLSAKLQQANAGHKEPGAIDIIAARYYRFAQFRNLILWFFTWHIPARLKLGRMKNLAIGVLALSRSRVAEELKHMRNEVSSYRHGYDFVGLKNKEKDRLIYLADHPKETPIFIILRDRYEPLKQLLKWLESQSLKKIIFIDNDSGLPPLVDFLDNTNYQVLELGRNMKQTAPWNAGIIKVLLPDDFYVVTDPDIIPVDTDENILGHFYEVHKKYPHHLKVGFGLKIDDLPDYYPLKKDVIKWESQFWRHPLEEDVYEAGVDTTFAVYKPYTYQYTIHPSIRLGGKYVARHLPWYSKADDLSDEEIFYRLRADYNVNTWNKDHLPDRYKKELAKQRH